MAERIIVGIVSLLIILCVFVYCTDVLTVISKNMEFYDICRGYMHIAEQNSGLSYEEKTRLKERLIAGGFDNVVIIAPEAAVYGSMFNLNVKASYSINMITDIFTRNIQEYVMSFDQNIAARKIR